MKNYAFIFARGGSKGLQKKNIKPLNGKPLIYYSINIAKKCELIESVFVSTEDEEIRNIAKKNGAIVVDRPKRLSTDSAPEIEAWKHAIEHCYSKYGEFDNFISLPSTSPLRSEVDINNAIKHLDTTNADICISICRSSRSPYFNMVKLDDESRNSVSLLIKNQNTISRRQDTPKTFDITTVVYAAKPNYILSADSILEGDVVAVEVPRERSIDIDDIIDFQLAENLLKNTHE
tara:strand:- start:18784 stop:19482 length:699 start_codon:yes stop_codon:yes gene_type:complete